ncbi:MAG: hypothetical protein JST00_14265 [Deltaproteobacteria bacterium]|nr:hypothetical protein [Deltaproteobacteria bacterium]
MLHSSSGRVLGLATVALVLGSSSLAFAQQPPPSADPAPSPSAAPTATLTASPAPAQAAAPAPAPAPSEASSNGGEELRRLDELVHHFGETATNRNRWIGLAALGSSALIIPTGAVLLDKDDSNVAGPLMLGLGISAGAFGTALFVSSFFSVDPYQQLADRIADERRAGRPASEIVTTVEHEWREKAAKARTARTVGGAFSLGFGALLLAGGTVLTLADVTGEDFSKKQQYGFATVTMSLGYGSVLSGVHSLLVEQPIESSWRSYSEGKGLGPKKAALRVQPPSLAPMPGGAYVSLGATF